MFDDAVGVVVVVGTEILLLVVILDRTNEVDRRGRVETRVVIGVIFQDHTTLGVVKEESERSITTTTTTSRCSIHSDLDITLVDGCCCRFVRRAF